MLIPTNKHQLKYDDRSEKKHRLIGLSTDCSNSVLSKLNPGAYGASLSASLLNFIDVLDIKIYPTYTRLTTTTYIQLTIVRRNLKEKYEKRRDESRQRRDEAT